MWRVVSSVTTADASVRSVAAPMLTLPEGARARVATAADLERAIEFHNRYARPGGWQAVDLAKRFEAANPQPKRLWLVVEDADGDIVAVASASDGGHFAPPDGTFQGGVRVAPEWRRKGIGGALLAALETHARAQGTPKLRGSVRGDEPDGLVFAERRGYREYHRRIDSYLEVQAFDPAPFEAPEAVARRTGVRFASYAECAPKRADELEGFQRELYELNRELAQDIPRPEPLPPPPPFEAVRGMFFDPPAFDTETTILALRDGRIVALTMTELKPTGVAYTFMTGVARPERGVGLALALKLQAIAGLRAKGARLFGTTNDPANAPMRGINQRLGYRPDPPSIHVEKVFA